MKQAVLSFVSAFALSAGLAGTGGGCLADDCNCPSTPDLPDPQGPLPDLSVSSYDAVGNGAETELRPEAGTIEIAGHTLLVVYVQDGVHHRVEYEITTP